MTDTTWKDIEAVLGRAAQSHEDLRAVINRLWDERESWRKEAERVQDDLDDAEERIRRLEVERDEAMEAKDCADENYTRLEDSEEKKRGDLDIRIRYLEECVLVRDEHHSEAFCIYDSNVGPCDPATCPTVTHPLKETP